MQTKFLFIDAETDGLYGSFLTVGLVVTDDAGNMIEKAYYGIKKENMMISDVWTRENVFPVLGDYEACEDEAELLEKVWAFWMKYREEAYAAADVMYPVESRLFMKCVMNNESERKYLGPFPMLDLSSLLMAAGYDPLIDRAELLDEDENGRLRLSIRQALPPEPPRQSKAEFEDTLSRFLKQSEERQLDVKRNIRKKSGGKGRR